MTDDDVSRRQFLETGALAVTLGLTTTVDDVDTAQAGEALDESRNQIRAPFDELPTLTNPTEEIRERARFRFGPAAAPEQGPVVNPLHNEKFETPVWVPEWVLEATRWRLQKCAEEVGCDRIDRVLVIDWLLEYVQAYEVFLTPDGRDAADVLLEEFDR